MAILEKFAELGLTEITLKALEAKGFEETNTDSGSNYTFIIKG